jgi:hypothetical protein
MAFGLSASDPLLSWGSFAGRRLIFLRISAEGEGDSGENAAPCLSPSGIGSTRKGMFSTGVEDFPNFVVAS